MRIRVLAMKHLTSKLLLLSLLVLDSARADQAGRTPGAGARPAVQEAPPSSVTHAASRPSSTGPAQHFTARCASIRCSNRASRPACPAPP